MENNEIIYFLLFEIIRDYRIRFIRQICRRRAFDQIRVDFESLHCVKRLRKIVYFSVEEKKIHF